MLKPSTYRPTVEGMINTNTNRKPCANVARNSRMEFWAAERDSEGRIAIETALTIRPSGN